MWKVYRWMQPWSNLKFFFGILREGLGKTHNKILSEYFLFQSEPSNLVADCALNQNVAFMVGG
jgi:hypothetical protein